MTSVGPAPASSLPADCGMPVPFMFLSDGNEMTFQHDAILPSLTVPSLDGTLAKYLLSVKPFVTEEEFKKTQTIVNEFFNGIGQELHLKLLERARHHKNWLETWWEQYAYLCLRMPHAPYVNFSGPAPYSREAWPPKDSIQIQRAAMVTWYMLKFWEILRKEQLRVDRGGKKTVWSMHQFYRMYNGCKTPGHSVDYLNHYFKTEAEGPVPTHLLVICKGRYFTFNALDPDGKRILTVPELELQLRRVCSQCDEKPYGSAVGALTAQDRSIWYELRGHLISLHAKNEHHLEMIQKSIFVIVLDDASPMSLTEIAREGHIGNAQLRWFDKTMTCIFFNNGTTASNCDHAPHDAMINVVLSYFIYLGLEECAYQWRGPTVTSVLPIPEELTFHLDDKIIEAISVAVQLYQKANDSLEILVTHFTDFGKNLIRQFNFHPDAFVQMAIQLGYYKFHHKSAPTYETASTRKFYHGRTETLRSCTTASYKWTESMLDPSASDSQKLKLLRTAIEIHLRNMVDAQEGHGCDRHLFGLQIIAMEEGFPTPEIFIDKSWTKSGGGGNYILSTSCIGYSPVIGGVAPMCKDGYGVFYSIEPDRINFFLSCWTSDQDTSTFGLYDSISESLLSMKRLVETTAEAHL